MTTQLLLEVGGSFYSLDLFEEIPVTANLSINSITNLQERSAGFSNTFTLPGTKNNKEIFNNFYEANGVDFNPLLRRNCVIQKQGNDIFRGTLRLNSVINTGDYQEFEVYIVSDVGDFVGEIDGLNLNDLSWGDLYHSQTYDNVFESWKATTGDTAGLFGGKILYGLTHNGYVYNSVDLPTFEFKLSGTSTFTSIANPVPTTYFKPQIRLKEVLDRVFSASTYTVISDFFDSPYFRSIYMTLANNGDYGIGTPQASENQNYFRVYSQGNYEIGNSAGDRIVFPFGTYLDDGYDHLNNYSLTNYPTSNEELDPSLNSQLVNAFQVPFPGRYAFNLQFSHKKKVPAVIKQDFYVEMWTGTTKDVINSGNIVDTRLCEAGNSFTSQDFFFNKSLNPGTYVGLAFRIASSIAINKQVEIRGFSQADDSMPRFDLYASPRSIPATEVDIQTQLPDLNCVDLLKSVISMFNLLVIEDDVNKTIEFIPYNDYFNQPDRVVRDWTDKLALDKSWKVSTLDFNLKKDVIYTYKSGEEESLNKYQETNFNRIYGTRNYTSASNILKGEEKIEFPFTATPTKNIDDSEDFIIPYLFDRDDNDKLIPTKNKNPHLVFWTGNRYNYVDKEQTTPFEWYMLSGTTGGTVSVAQSTYPCLSHLSKLTSGGSNTFSDLNFDRYWDYFATVNDEINLYSNYTIFDGFHSQHINQLYSSEARKLEGSFVLDPQEIGELSFNDIIFLKDTNYRIQEIKDANLIRKDFNDVVLVKELGGFNSVDLPIPDYSIEPDTTPPAPSPTPTPTPSSTPEACVCEEWELGNENPYSVIYEYTDCNGTFHSETLGASQIAYLCKCDNTTISTIGGSLVISKIGSCTPATPTPTPTPDPTPVTPTPTPSAYSGPCYEYEVQNLSIESQLSVDYSPCGNCLSTTNVLINPGDYLYLCACEDSVSIVFGSGSITKGLPC